MWSFEKLDRRRLAGLAAAVLAVGLVAGCQFSPLYGRGAAATGPGFVYGDPSSRIEQIVYQNMWLRLGKTEDPGAPLITISASASSRSIGRSSTGLPITTSEMTVTATATVSGLPAAGPDDKGSFTVSRAASATYTTNGQTLADRESALNAEQRAAKAASESLVLLIRARTGR